MILKQFNDGSCEFKFSLKERLSLFFIGKIFLDVKTFSAFKMTFLKMIVGFDSKILDKKIDT